jgi:hypothetical protein
MPPTQSAQASSPNIDGGGWILVRHVPAGATWHPATDLLVGTSVYGDSSQGPKSSAAWSINFEDMDFDQFLFATGDETKWLIADKDQVTGSFYSNESRHIARSSLTDQPYVAKWYRRQQGFQEDPWISLTDHGEAIHHLQILYGENSNGKASHADVLRAHAGANVFIRRADPISLALPRIPAAPFLSSFHEVVGNDGVLMLVLERAAYRYTHAVNQLKRIGIYPVTIAATDGTCASPQALAKGCSSGKKNCQGRTGNGCTGEAEKGIADSHRRALEAALRRENDWTAILEDDAVPVLIEGLNWDAEFHRAWATRPADAKFVRLSWCSAPGVAVGPRITEPASAANGQFQFIKNAVGGCTAAYMVHKSIIPKLLKVFPCCCAVDCCYEWDFFSKNPSSITNLVAIGSDAYISSHEKSEWGKHHGVMMQAKKSLPSTRMP